MRPHARPATAQAKARAQGHHRIAERPQFLGQYAGDDERLALALHAAQEMGDGGQLAVQLLAADVVDEYDAGAKQVAAEQLHLHTLAAGEVAHMRAGVKAQAEFLQYPLRPPVQLPAPGQVRL